MGTPQTTKNEVDEITFIHYIRKSRMKLVLIRISIQRATTRKVHDQKLMKHMELHCQSCTVKQGIAFEIWDARTYSTNE